MENHLSVSDDKILRAFDYGHDALHYTTQSIAKPTYHTFHQNSSEPSWGQRPSSVKINPGHVDHANNSIVHREVLYLEPHEIKAAQPQSFFHRTASEIQINPQSRVSGNLAANYALAPTVTTTISFGGAVDFAHSTQLTSKYFGVVVKTGESEKDNGVVATGGYTNYAQALVGETTTTHALSVLSVGSLRYPGGTESRLFSITDATDIAGLHRALDYCGKNGISLNFTINDAPYVNPNTGVVTITAVLSSALKHFIQTDLLGYASSVGAVVESIHIGNEFSGREDTYGVQPWKGYARVAAVLTNSLRTILTEYESLHPCPAPQIAIEPPTWDLRTYQSQFMSILNQNGGATHNIDAIDIHGNGGSSLATLTLGLTWDGYYGKADASSYEARLAHIIDLWRSNPDTCNVNFRVDAWSYDTVGGPSLENAALGMLQMHTFSKLGIISATSYVGYGYEGANGRTDCVALARPGDANCTTVQLRAGGELFAMMQHALIGTEAINFAGALNATAEHDAGTLTRAFAGGDKAVLYVVNRAATDLAVDLVSQSLVNSLESFAGGVSNVSVDILGSSVPTDIDGTPTHELRTLSIAQIDCGAADFTLNSLEIAQVSLTAVGNFGTDDADILRGTDHADVLHGLAGDDILIGGGGDDKLAGGTGNDQLFGGAGNDILYGGAGADTLDGGYGTDTVDYSYAHGAVLVNLTTQSNSGDAKGDRFTSIESVVGSAFGDTLTGNVAANRLEGGDGDDSFYLSAGADTFSGGSGTGDTLCLDDTATLINLSNGENNRGIFVTGIENVTGGNGADRVIGDLGNNILVGGAGDDTMSGYNGDDRLVGGVGNDWLYGLQGSDSLLGDSGCDHLGGGDGNDSLAGGAGIDQLSGGSGNDEFYFYSISECGDKISDFGAVSGNDDRMMISAQGFGGGLMAGALAQSQYCVRLNDHNAQDGDDRFILCESDKSLWYDADGSGATGACLVAQLQTAATNLSANDIWLI